MGKNLHLALLALTLFAIPSNWFLKITSEGSYVNGLQVDYLIPKLYFSLLAATGFSLVWSWHKRKKIWNWLRDHKSTVLLMGLFWTVLGARQLVVAEPLQSIWMFVQLTIGVWFGVALVERRALLQERAILITLYLTAVFQAALGVLQFIMQKQLVGYPLFGEGTLTLPFGIATASFSGAERILAYGTTPHPNILAGVVVGLLITWWLGYSTQIQRADILKKPKPAALVLGALISTLATLYSTQSLSGLLLFGFGLLVLLAKNYDLNIQKIKIIGLCIVLLGLPVMLFFSQQLFVESEVPTSISRRILLNQAAVNQFLSTPLFGTGLNTFTREVEYLGGSEVVRFVQPAHHVGLLALAEGGALLALLAVFTLKTTSKKAQIAVLTTAFILSAPAALDHYLYTLPHGVLLATILYIAVLKSEESNSLSREKKHN